MREENFSPAEKRNNNDDENYSQTPEFHNYSTKMNFFS